jgi:hypothetical protein
MTVKTRVWLYAILLAAQPLAAFYGLVNDTSGALWVNFLAAILTGGVVASNLTPDNQVTVGVTVEELDTNPDGPDHRA